MFGKETPMIEPSEQCSDAGSSGRSSSPWTIRRADAFLRAGMFLGGMATLQLWRRVRVEFVIELAILRQRWKMLVFGIVMQYVHGIFTQLAHRMHTNPMDSPIHDIGFELTAELGADKHWVSEALFGTLFASFVAWTFSPFFSPRRKKFYTVVVWSRLLMVLVACQVLRILSFSVTQLPGPSFHCRSGQPTAIRPWPTHWYQHLIVDVSRQISMSCGDLIFSSHTIFTLSGILMYTEYGSLLPVKVVAWLCGIILSFLIVASRKHYTVDIVIAWYTVPLVFYALLRRWTMTRPPSMDLLTLLGENNEPGRAVEGDRAGSADDDIEKGSGAAGGGGRSSLVVGSDQPLLVKLPSSLMLSATGKDSRGSSGRPLDPSILGVRYSFECDGSVNSDPRGLSLGTFIRQRQVVNSSGQSSPAESFLVIRTPPDEDDRSSSSSLMEAEPWPQHEASRAAAAWGTATPHSRRG